MARMHSRDKGKSGSTKPSNPSTPSWIVYDKNEIELIVAKLAKEGKSMSEIGIIMRDTYGIPSLKQVAGKKVKAILDEKGVKHELPEDLISLIKRSLAIRKHIESNKQDQTAKRGLQLTDSKIGRLAKYYKANGKISADWKYDPKNVRFV